MWGKNSSGQLGLGKSISLFHSIVYALLFMSYYVKFLALFTCSFPFYIFSYEEAARVVRVPTKVEALHGITIQSVALGSEHSVAVTGLDPRSYLDTEENTFSFLLSIRRES